MIIFLKYSNPQIYVSSKQWNLKKNPQKLMPLKTDEPQYYFFQFYENLNLLDLP